MSIYNKEQEFDLHTEQIKHIQMGVLSADTIRRISVVEIKRQDTYNGDMPVQDGLFDLRMGSIEMGKECKTCRERSDKCPGHFGHIELAWPVYQIPFLSTVLAILPCICINCGQPLIDFNETTIQRRLMDKKGHARLKEVQNLVSKVKVCGVKSGKWNDPCGYVQPEKYSKSGFCEINAHFKKDTQKEGTFIPIKVIHRLLRNMDDEMITWLGFHPEFARPEDMIATVFPVPPPCVRPSVRQDNHQRCDDDLTFKLVDIISANNNFNETKKKVRLMEDEVQRLRHEGKETEARELKKKAVYQIECAWQVLQYHTGTFVDNEMFGLQATQRSGRAIRSIRQRLKSKEGRIRGNLMGKRVDFSARSVITPDPSLCFDQLGVPSEIAMNLTIPEMVTEKNIDTMRQYVKNGCETWPGAKSIIRFDEVKKTPDVFYIRFIKGEIDLKIGDIVNRHMVNDDVVFFNRQPSLHKMSMMGHRVKVVPDDGKTFRLNTIVCPPYNADFDGDEMNMHVPQSMQCIAEIQELALVPSQLVSPASNSPTIGLIQDALLGCFLFTHEDVVIDKSFMNDLCVAAEIPLQKVTHRDSISGRDLFSLILSDNLYLEKKPRYMKEKCVIEKGKIKSGVLDKGILTTTGSIGHILFNDEGAACATKFLHRSQNIAMKWLMQNSWSVGIGDCVPPDDVLRNMQEFIKKGKDEVSTVHEDAARGRIKHVNGLNLESQIENQTNQKLNKIREDIGNMAISSLKSDNRFVKIVQSGSKGSTLNIAQSAACVGQQNVPDPLTDKMGRISFDWTNRTLPHFTAYDQSPESRGFVENSYMSGLTPNELFFHAKAGRNGLIDTAIKTADTGYIQRRLIKGMEDLKVHQDGTIRSVNNQIIQLFCGGDGFDGTFIEKQYLPCLTESLSEFKKRLHPDTFLKNEVTQKKREWSALLEARRSLQNSINENQQGHDRDTSVFHTPFPVHRMVKIFQPKNPNPAAAIKLKTFLDKIQTFLESNQLSLFNQRSGFINHFLRVSLLNSCILLRDYHYDEPSIDNLLHDIVKRNRSSRINPGEMVGIIAAQSIGEPTTQMTLNTFHHTGISSKSNVANGVPRFKEITSNTKKPNTPSLTVYFKDNIGRKKEDVIQARASIPFTKLRDVLSEIKIIWGDTNHVIPFIDTPLSRVVAKYTHCCLAPPRIMIEMTFDLFSLFEKKITLFDIQNKFGMGQLDIRGKLILHTARTEEHLEYPKIFAWWSSPETDSNPDEDLSDIMAATKAFYNSCQNIVIQGVSGITGTTIREVTEPRLDMTKGVIREKEFILDTIGSNLQDICDIPSVDIYRTWSNHIQETFDVLGIEAARNVLIRELLFVINFDSCKIDHRHVELLADVMLARGNIMSMDRHGVNRSDTGILSKISFEEVPRMLDMASAFASRDDINSVSGSIIMGQFPIMGTNFQKIFYDEEMHAKCIKSQNSSKTTSQPTDEFGFDI